MTSETLRDIGTARNSVPAAVKELCLEQDRSSNRISKSIDSISSELAGPIDREVRHELAAAIGDVADELRTLHNRQLAAGFFDGFENANTHLHERVAHLLADYRRLLNELRTAQHETATGKASKASRQLTSWVGHFSDLIERESKLVSELWTADKSQA